MALEGSRASLEQMVVALQGDIFGLALRMLGNREGAQDATQKIRIRIVTHLSQFDFRSRLKMWAHRIAVNHVLDFRKSADQQRTMSFEQLGADVVAAISPEAPSDTERSLLVEEVKIGCTLGMLQCLDTPHRAADILGEIMEIPGPEAAEVLGISEAFFRKRLQKARTAMVAFLRNSVPVQLTDTGRAARTPNTILVVPELFHRNFVRRDASKSTQGGRGAPGARSASHQPTCGRVGGLRPKADRRQAKGESSAGSK